MEDLTLAGKRLTVKVFREWIPSDRRNLVLIDESLVEIHHLNPLRPACYGSGQRLAE
jgi:hypothetical protein